MNKTKILSALSWLFIIITITSAFLISRVEDYNIGFLGLLGINLIMALVVAGSSNKFILTFIKIAVGILFVYSGFVKGVDPLGTQFRIEDYFYAFNTLWAIPFALPLSVILNAFEFSLGLILIFNLRIRFTSWLVLLLMLFFTLTTLNDALYNPVPDCGCFGDALIISNWQTFYKNLVIFSFVLVLFLRKNSYVNLMTKSLQFSFMSVIFMVFIVFELYTIRHLPLIDFRPWKVGSRLIPENPRPASYYFTYKNNATGEEKEYLSKELPWQDSVFMATWSFVGSREVNPDAGMYKTFPMMDEDGNDMSFLLISSENPVFFMVLYDAAEVEKNTFQKFENVYKLCQENGWDFYLLSSAVPEDLEKIRKGMLMEGYPVLNSDDTSLKAAIRSNPGLILVKQGVVKAKYNYREIPDTEALHKIANQ